MAYKGHLEDLSRYDRVDCLRIFSDGKVPFVDEYDIAGTACYLYSHGTVELKGVCSRGTIKFARLRQLMRDVFKDTPAKVLIWRRRHPGGEYTIKMDLTTGRLLST